MSLIQFFSSKIIKPTHAGGVVVRQNNGINEYLLVSAKRFSFIWVLPKGHIEKGETEEKAAVREVLEESGIKASIVEKIGNAKRLKWILQLQCVAFFLMELKSVNHINRENRKVVWLPYEQAVKKLFYKEQRQIFKKVKS